MDNLIGSALDMIPKIVYFLTMSLTSVIDLLQMLFRKLAGLDCYYKDGTAQTGDVLYDFLRGIFMGDYNILSSVFWGLVVLGAILLFMSTFIAVIRSEYTTEKDGNSKGKIIGKAFKSIIYVAIIPIVCIFGIYLANVMLVAVDKATTYNTAYTDTLDKTKLKAVKVSSFMFGQETVQTTYITYGLFNLTDDNGLPYGTTTTTFSGTIFKASAYTCNRIRDSVNETEDKRFGTLLLKGDVTTFDGLFMDPNEDLNKIATKIDIAFGDNVVFKTGESLNYQNDYIRDTLNRDGWSVYKRTTTTQTFASKFNVELVWYYYNLWHFNFIVAVAAGVIMITVLLNVIFGLMRRIIEILGLFLMAPPLIALMPLDEEKAYKGWRTKFLSNALMAYGAVAGMNIVLLLLPEIQTIKFFNNDFLNWITDTLFVIVALLAIKEFIGMISGFIGGADANKTGEGVGKEVGAMAAKAGKLAASTVGVAGAGALSAAKMGLSAAKKVGSKAKYKHLMKDAGGTNQKATALAKKNAQASDNAAAEEEVFNQFKDDGINRLDAENELDRVHGKGYMDDLKSRDSAKYQEMVDAQLKSTFNEYKNKGLDLGGGSLGTSIKDEIQARYLVKQKNDHIVKNEEVAATTQYGQKKADKEAYEKEKADITRAIGAGFATSADLKLAKKTHRAEARHKFGTAAAGYAKPVGTSFGNFAVTAIDTGTSGSGFLSEALGKENENIKDLGMRIVGQTYAARAGKKKAEKEKAAAVSAAQMQAKYTAEALEGILRKLKS